MINSNIRAKLQQIQKKRHRLPTTEDETVTIEREVANPLQPIDQNATENDDDENTDEGLIQFEKFGAAIWNEGF